MLIYEALKFAATGAEARNEIGVTRGDANDAGKKGEAIIFVHDNGIGLVERRIIPRHGDRVG